MRHVLQSGLLCALAASCASLIGCATATPAGQRYQADPAPIVAAGFRLQGIRVLWQDNPGFGYRFSFMASKYDKNPTPSEAEKARVASQMKTILDFYRNGAVPMLTQALMNEGVPAGSEHRIALMPVSAYQGVGSAGTTFIVRATVLDNAGRPVWTIDIESYSGMYWLGGRFIQPDDSYVRNFVSALTQSMRRAGLIGKA